VGFTDSHHGRATSRRTEQDRAVQWRRTWSASSGEQVPAPVAYFERSWLDEEWSRGCYTGMMLLSSFFTLGPALREPVGLIHWAGTETAVIWNRYIDGAIRSGEDAVLAGLRAPAAAAQAGAR
jgi:monoamine oxidase